MIWRSGSDLWRGSSEYMRIPTEILPKTLLKRCALIARSDDELVQDLPAAVNGTSGPSSTAWGPHMLRDDRLLRRPRPHTAPG